MTARRAIALWGPVLAVAATLFALSSSPSLPGIVHAPDKLLHGAAYALLGTLCLRAAHGGLGPPRLVPTAWTVVLCLAYAAFEEWNQSRIPGRDPSVGDWLADGAGLAVAWLSVRLLTRRRAAGSDANGKT